MFRQSLTSGKFDGVVDEADEVVEAELEAELIPDIDIELEVELASTQLIHSNPAL